MRDPHAQGSRGWRRTGRVAVALGLGVLCVQLAPGIAGAQEPPPDVVLIVTDDQRFDTLWAMPIVTERLVAQGVTFPDAFVVNAICCPSRASILTGNYSHTTLVYGQVPPFGRFEWFDDVSTLATWLDDAGYATGLFGKYLNGYQHAALTGYVPPGWDRWVAFVSPAAHDYALTIDGEVSRFGLEHSTEVLAEEVVRFVLDADGPLFVLFAPSSPHAPATPTDGFAEAFSDLTPARPPSFDEADVSDKPSWVRDLPPLGPSEEAAVDALRIQEYRALSGVDAAIGRILDSLQAAGRLENALIVLTSDNGLLHGEHRWMKKEAAYEESIRVPLVLRWDAGGLDSGVRLDGILALNVDLAPTIAEIARVTHPPTDGRSLLPLIRDPYAPWREDFLIEHLEGGNPIPTYCAVRSNRWKYVRYATDEEELYDLSKDPYELQNLAADPSHAWALRDARQRLRELCVPPPPGYEDGWSATLPLAVSALAGIFVLEAMAGRRASRRAGVGR